MKIFQIFYFQIILSIICCAPIFAGDRYIANPENFEEKFAQLQAGDILVLEDGYYERGILIRGRHGEEGAPITIKAKNERKAFFRTDGSEPTLHIVNSSYWHIEGLRLENQDNPKYDSGTEGGLILVTGSSHIVIRRNLCSWPNRWGNNTGIKLDGGTTHSLVEENELYDFHRNGISFHGVETRFNVLRRNYVSRGVEHKGRSWGPNDGIVMYRGADNIIENNIVEFSDNEGHGFGIWGERNKILGNIAFKTRAGFPVVQGWRAHSGHADGSQLKNNLALNSNSTGFYTNSVADIIFENNSSIGSAGNGITLHNERKDLRGEEFQPSVRVINHFSAGNEGYGFEIRHPDEFSEAEIVYSYGWNNTKGTWGAGTENVQQNEDIDPGFGGTSSSFSPVESPLKGMGRKGTDAGATILYRYMYGELTDEPIWDPENGTFPHGAVIREVNDSSNNSLFNFHKRLFP